MDGQQETGGAIEDQMVQATPRAQLPDVARLTGIPERTLQHWFREYGSYRSRRGYPQQLILDVLRDHDWEGDTGNVLRGLEAGPTPQQAIERHASLAPEPFRDQERRLEAIAARCESLAEDLVAFRSEHAEASVALFRELQQLHALSTQVATLNEVRGVREDLLAVRAGQLRAEQAQQETQAQLRQVQSALARRRWWPFGRKGR